MIVPESFVPLVSYSYMCLLFPGCSCRIIYPFFLPTRLFQCMLPARVLFFYALMFPAHLFLSTFLFHVPTLLFPKYFFVLCTKVFCTWYLSTFSCTCFLSLYCSHHSLFSKFLIHICSQYFDHCKSVLILTIVSQYLLYCAALRVIRTF